MTILEFSDTVVDPSQKNYVKNEPKEDVTQPKIDIIVETNPCENVKKKFSRSWGHSLYTGAKPIILRHYNIHMDL